MPPAGARLYLAGDDDDATVVDSSGALVIAGPIVEVVRMLALVEATICTLDPGLLSSVVEVYLDNGQIADMDVALRGSGMTGAPTPLSIRRTGWGARWLDVSAQFPDSDALTTADGLGAGRPAPWSIDHARWLANLHAGWLEMAELAIGAELSITLASTAAKLGIPRQWRRAFTAAGAHKPRKDGFDLSGWHVAHRAFFGGRVTCRVDQDWRGEAVEYDLRSAYGWAMTTRLPDWKTYDRKPWPSQPAWYDVTVETLTGLGPLPYRAQAGAAVLSYPSSGEVVRGVWTREDLDRATDCGAARVVEQHGAMSGRWSHDLAPVVSGWLDAREKATLAPIRALFRFLSNSLAGKLVQKSQGWRLWDARHGAPPARAVALAMNGWAWAYPVAAAFQPVTCPQAGSYITARVRSRVWPELSRPDALYSDTDSVHLPADAAPPAGMGPGPGQWVEKARGPARYYGPKRYSVGNKHARGLRVF